MWWFLRRLRRRGSLWYFDGAVGLPSSLIDLDRVDQPIRFAEITRVLGHEVLASRVVVAPDIALPLRLRHVDAAKVRVQDL